MYHFMLHDAKFYFERLCPAIAASARARSHAPMRALAEELAPTIEAFVKKYHLTNDERPLIGALATARFDRRNWRFYAGEFLLYAAAESLETKIEADVLAQCIPSELACRLHRGSRDVEFQGFPYRPGRAGLHDVSDLEKLDGELAAIDPAGWSAAALAEVDDFDRDDELEWIRNRFAELRAIVERARAANCVIVCEEV